MKKPVQALVAIILPVLCWSQKSVPDITLRSNRNVEINLKKLADTASHPIIISFWATWCSPCINELDAISEMYSDWQSETGVELIAVSIDDARSTSRANTLATGKGWNYTILFDENQELKRALNIANVPATLVLYKGAIVYTHNSYHPGDEDEVFEKIKSLK